MNRPLERGIYAASLALCPAALKRHKCRAPCSGAQGAHPVRGVLPSHQRKKREQAPRTPNAVAPCSRSRNIAKRLECVQLAGAFGSWSQCALQTRWRLPSKQSAAVLTRRHQIGFGAYEVAPASWTAATESAESPLWIGRMKEEANFLPFHLHQAKAVTALRLSPQSKTLRARGLKPSTAIGKRAASNWRKLGGPALK